MSTGLLFAQVGGRMPAAPGGTLAAMADKQALGAYGEKLAAQYLRESGMEIVARNWRCRYGELDLIVQDPQITAFVEVKTRSGLGFGVPAESVTFSKQQRIRRLALLWLAEQEGPWRRIRFDVVSVLVPRGHRPVIDHLTAAF